MAFSRVWLLIVLTIATVSPYTAHAAINKEGAAKVKVLVDNFLKEQKKLSEIDGVTKVTYQGETLVEEAKDYYAVTLPYAKLTYPDGDQIDIGMLSINASEGDTPGQWKLRVAVPTPIIMVDRDGKELIRMNIGAQRAAGIWDESMQGFVKLDALYQDINFTGPTGNFKIPEAQVIYDFTKDAAGKWSGPGSIALKNPEGSFMQGTMMMKAASAKVNFTMDKYNANSIRAYREKMAALSETLNADGTKKAAVSPNHTSAIASTLMDFLTGSGNGMKIGYDITGLVVTNPATENSAARILNLPKLALALDLGDFESGKAHFGLKAALNGLNVTPQEPIDQDLTPSDANIDMMIENIPVKEIIELGKNTIDAAMTQPSMQQLAGVSFLFKVPSLLSQAGTFMVVKDSYIGNNSYNVQIDGRARADISAVSSATADGKLVVRGLDFLLEKLKIKQQTPPVADAEKLATTIGFLESVKQKARVESAPGKPTLHIMDFSVTPKGETLINGKDARAPAEKSAKPSMPPAPVTPVQKAPIP